MDPALQYLIDQAQAGIQLPPIKILAGGTLYVGHLGTEGQVEERFRYGLSEELFNEVAPRKHREADGVAERSVDRARDLAEPILPKLREGAEAFTLLNCQVWVDGSGAQVAAIRILHAAVEAWWLGAHSALSQGGGGFLGGVLVPVGGSGG